MQGWIDALYYIDNEIPYRKTDFYDAIKPSSMEQHLWWDRELLADIQKVNVYASGIGIYSLTLLKSHGAISINMLDYDEEVTEINWRLAHSMKGDIEFVQSTLDVNFDPISKDVDTVLCTNCEDLYHFYDLKQGYRPNTLFILQGTNLPKKGNINLSKNLDAFILSTGLDVILFEGEIEIEDGYKRFMVIGK